MKELKMTVIFIVNLILQLIELGINGLVLFAVPFILIYFGVTTTTIIISAVLAVIFGTFIVFSLTGYGSLLELFKQQLKHLKKVD